MKLEFVWGANVSREVVYRNQDFYVKDTDVRCPGGTKTVHVISGFYGLKFEGRVFVGLFVSAPPITDTYIVR